jgi:hypothetical protein
MDEPPKSHKRKSELRLGLRSRLKLAGSGHLGVGPKFFLAAFDVATGPERYGLEVLMP